MRPIGFSTGALARGDFSRGLELLKEAGLRRIELSALRTEELPGLMHYIRGANLDDFDYVSIHAPAAYATDSEVGIVDALTPAIEKRLHVVVHPDAICDFKPWRRFGSLLCVENMDKRKPIGRTVQELSKIFEKLPDASFCLDVAHTRQVDPTMGAAADLLRHFTDRLAQVHVSDVNSNSGHERLNLAASLAFKKIASFIPRSVPLILESPLYSEPESRMHGEIESEVNKAQSAFRIPPTEQEIGDIWKKFRAEKTEAQRDLLMMEYLPLVRYNAERIYSRLPDEVDLDDLIQAGSFGLKDAIESFDPGSGVKFEIYCVPRIREAVLNELCNMDRIPGLVRSRGSKIVQASRQLEIKLGRAPSHGEIASSLGVSGDEFEEMLRESSAVSHVRLPRKRIDTDGNGDVHDIDMLEMFNAASLPGEIYRSEIKELITRGLSRSEKMILVLYYYEEMTVKEIGDALELSESRVRKMHADIIARLKERMTERDCMRAILGGGLER